MIRAYLVPDDRDLAVQEVVAHDRVGDRAGVHFAVFQVSQEKHVHAAFEPDDAVFQVHELEVAVEVGLAKREGLVFEVGQASD